MSIIPSLSFLDPIIQDNTLRRMFHDQLYPELLYRMEAIPEKWEAQQGDTYIETRGSDLPVITKPLKAGSDPVPTREAYEQWKLVADQHSNGLDTQLPPSRAAMASKFAKDARSLALNAGKSLNRLYRNQLFTPYVAGTTIADNAGGPGTVVEVGSINGFTEVLVDGQITPVSSSNPKTAYIGGVEVRVIAAAPDDAENFPLGKGLLTLEAPGATWVAGAVVKADDATRQIFAGGAATVDGITSANILRLEDVRTAVAYLQASNVPPHEDGSYHVHIDPLVASQLYSDNEFQRTNEGRYDGDPYRRFVIGELLGMYFFRNTESPNLENSGGSDNTLYQQSRPTNAPNARLGTDISGEMRNKDGVAIARTIITGGGSGYEKYIPEAEYLTEAGTQGKVGEFSVTTQGMTVDVSRVRYTIRAPQDRLQQIVGQAWSWSGDHGIPSDKLGGRGRARYKRAIVINSGMAG